MPGYIGFDATAPSLHVGSLVQIMMLRRLQQAGHKPIVLMGGGTTKVGDPSGKDESRKLLDDAAIKGNIASIRRVFEQFLTFGDGPTDAIMVDNDDWLAALDYIPFLRDIGPHFTINRMLTFDCVKLRLEREQPLTFLEFNYMILQAYDFLELSRRAQCRLQMGGSDQWGNIVNGIELARRVDGTQVFGLTTPLITTADGGKMGKTAAGAVWLNADAAAALRLLAILAEHPGRRRRQVPAPVHRPAARRDRAARSAARAARSTRPRRSSPTKRPRWRMAARPPTTPPKPRAGPSRRARPARSLPTLQVDGDQIGIVDALTVLGFAASNGEARRKIAEGAVRLNGEVISDPGFVVTLRDRRAAQAQPRQEEARPADALARRAAAPPPRRAPSDRAGSAPPGRARRRGRRRGRPAAARRRSPTGSARRSARASARRNCGLARLARAEDLAGAAQPQILLGDAEAVIGLAHQGKPRARRFAERIAAQQQADRLCWSPRPTRPRSWWSWARPKRSACSTIISVALGTSTPTSITVVATSTAISPRWKAAITASFSGPFIRPWTTPTLSPKRSRSSCARSSAAARSLVSLSSTSGQTQ